MARSRGSKQGLVEMYKNGSKFIEPARDCMEVTCIYNTFAMLSLGRNNVLVKSITHRQG